MCILNLFTLVILYFRKLLRNILLLFFSCFSIWYSTLIFTTWLFSEILLKKLLVSLFKFLSCFNCWSTHINVEKFWPTWDSTCFISTKSSYSIFCSYRTFNSWTRPIYVRLSWSSPGFILLLFVALRALITWGLFWT